MNCGSAISDTCKTATLGDFSTISDKLIENKFKRLASEIVSVGMFVITTLMAASASSMSINMTKGLNAMRCAFLSGFINIWMLMGSLYFAARQFKQQKLLTDKLDEYYPYICTCKEDVANLQKMMSVTG
jgi:uncharacterized membrane protein YkvI